ncbi:hypothetical protein [Streptococcus sinensis]|uniref:hypothetical protein n=1 Tax=Streptococcus sinensis TaxID=176090 RepID=UPI001CEDE99A|nr:hypothetical protein [Streptococcus sinensis]MCD1277881.1 hypothetical protein [Streptococcus sinensis]
MTTTLTEDITGVFAVGSYDDLGTRLFAIQKQIEKSLITNIYAPHALSNRDAIKSKSKRAISKIAKEGKSVINGIVPLRDNGQNPLERLLQQQAINMIRFSN